MIAGRNGAALLSRIREEKPDAVIMELFMPGLDALGVMHAVKSEGLSEPVFIVTASYSAPALEPVSYTHLYRSTPFEKYLRKLKTPLHNGYNSECAKAIAFGLPHCRLAMPAEDSYKKWG